MQIALIGDLEIVLLFNSLLSLEETFVITLCLNSGIKYGIYIQAPRRSI
jgi:hypothetical protein